MNAKVLIEIRKAVLGESFKDICDVTSDFDSDPDRCCQNQWLLPSPNDIHSRAKAFKHFSENNSLSFRECPWFFFSFSRPISPPPPASACHKISGDNQRTAWIKFSFSLTHFRCLSIRYEWLLFETLPSMMLKYDFKCGKLFVGCFRAWWNLFSCLSWWRRGFCHLIFSMLPFVHT